VSRFDYRPGLPVEPWWLRATVWVDRAYRSFCAAREELALSRLPPGAWREVSERRYGEASPFYSRREGVRVSLFEWESAAVASFFPPPPARILVGGAGGGRELAALARLGYRASGFDPSPPMYEALRKLASSLGGDVVVGCAGYEELVTVADSICDCSLRALGPIVDAAPYDAVILGFGSLSLVPSPAVRERLFPAVARLCPRGPVLASFEMASPPRGRAERVAALLRLLLRRIPGSHPVADGDALSCFGFQHAFTEEELRGLAENAGYRVALLSRDCSHTRF
jgi:SAM-dependent methyltransferase